MIKNIIMIIVALFGLSAFLAFANNEKGEAALAQGDFQTAFIEFSKAAENGDMNAQFNLGVMYEQGKGVEQSDLKAAEWYQKAADNGHPEAPMALQVLYEYF